MAHAKERTFGEAVVYLRNRSKILGIIAGGAGILTALYFLFLGIFFEIINMEKAFILTGFGMAGILFSIAGIIGGKLSVTKPKLSGVLMLFSGLLEILTIFGIISGLLLIYAGILAIIDSKNDCGSITSNSLRPERTYISKYVSSKLLTEGEKIIYETRPNWDMFIIPIGTVPFLGLGLLFLIPTLIKYFYTECVVTNQRVLIKKGLFSTNVYEMNLSQIESVVVEQSLWQKFFYSGHVIALGTGGLAEGFINIDNPFEFRKALLEAINDISESKKDAPPTTWN